jgi:hypothetical protein
MVPLPVVVVVWVAISITNKGFSTKLAPNNISIAAGSFFWLFF